MKQVCILLSNTAVDDNRTYKIKTTITHFRRVKQQYYSKI